VLKEVAKHPNFQKAFQKREPVTEIVATQGIPKKY
jgi:hypothetical protein